MMAHWLTLSRLGLAAVFCVGVSLCARPGGLSAGTVVGLVILGLLEELTDFLDGFVARKYRLASELGGILDPLADSLARLAIYFALALAGWVTVAVPLVMTGRDIVVAYSRIVQARVGGHTSARLAGKIKAALQGAGFPVLVVLAWLGDVWRPEVVGTVRTALSGTLVLGTAWSAWAYVRGAWPAARELARQRSGGTVRDDR
jgi:CDP-diacylglycerol--glycerol-3-phosphate 3-phosphatidyltransferase